MSVDGQECGVTEIVKDRHDVTGESTAAKQAAPEAEGEIAEAACVGGERVSREEGAYNGAPGDGSEETSSSGVRRPGLREVCLAFLKRFEVGAASEGAASDRPAGGREGSDETVREDASDSCTVEAGEDTTVLRLPAEDVRLGGSAAKAAVLQGLRGGLQRLSRNPAAVAIGAAAFGGVSILSLSVLLGGSGSAPSAALQKAGNRSSLAMAAAEPGLMAPSAKLATVALPDPQGPVVKPLPEKKAADALRDEVLSFGDGSRKAEGTRAAAAPERIEPQQVVLEPGLLEPGGERPSASAEKGTPSGISGAKPEGGHAADEGALGRGEARNGRGRDDEIQSAAAPATTHSEKAPKAAGAEGDPPGFRVAVVRPEDRGRNGGIREEKPPAIGQERSGDRQDKAAKEALGLVTQLGALLAEAREELAALKVDHERLRSVAEGRLGDLDNRVAFLEAKSAVAEARLAGRPPDAPAASPVPLAGPRQDPTRADALIEGGGDARIVKARAIEGGPSRETAGQRRYRVQAASPNLAMLAEIERSGGIGAQIEVALGDNVVGYGRVTKIVQRGTVWVVQTEKGTIE